MKVTSPGGGSPRRSRRAAPQAVGPAAAGSHHATAWQGSADLVAARLPELCWAAGWLAALTVGIWLAAAPLPAHAAGREVSIATVSDGPSELLTELRGKIEAEIKHLLEGEFRVRFPAPQQTQADWSQAGVHKALAGVLAAADVDLVIAVGPIASLEACRQQRLPKPVIATVVTNVGELAVPYAEGRSGRPNLTYFAAPWGPKQDLETFRSVVPYQSLAVLAPEAVLAYLGARGESPPKERRALRDSIVPVGADVKAALERLPEAADAVYLLPLLHLDREQREGLLTALKERRLPTFSVLGELGVEQGAMLGTTPSEHPELLARQVAVATHRILLGEDAGSLPVAFSSGSRLTLNAATARAVGVSPPYRVLMEARVIGDPQGEGRKLSLEQTVARALQANLDLAVAELETRVSAAEQSMARSNFLPSLDLATAATRIDSDRAEAGMGQQAETSWTASLTLKQVFSEGAFAYHRIQGHLLRSREAAEAAVRLDIVEAAVRAHLGLLRAATLRRIRKDNLRISRSNLELARKRLSIGSATPAEVYRWEAEIAQRGQDLIAAQVQVRLAGMELGRLLRFELDEGFSLDDLDVRPGHGIPSTASRLQRVFDNPRSMQAFVEFAAQQAVQRAPELRQIDAGVAATERSLLSTRRSFWLPALVLQGQLGHTLAESEQEEAATTPGMPNLASMLPEQDDTTWSLTAALQWPLLEGGQRWWQLDRDGRELERLKTQRRATAQRIEQRARATVLQAQASGMSSVLAARAAEAASKSLTLVTAAYARGAVSIVGLLDAQNAALVARLGAASASYQHLSDLASAQRAMGGSPVLEGEQARADWLEELDAFLRERLGEAATLFKE